MSHFHLLLTSHLLGVAQLFAKVAQVQVDRFKGLDLLCSSVSLEAAGFAQIYQADLAKIGVNGVIRTLEPAALLDAWHTQTYGLYFASDPWSNLEPVTQFTSGSTTNYRGNNGKRPKGDRILIFDTAGKSKVFYQGKDIDSTMGICVLGNKVIVSCSPTSTRVPRAMK